MGPHIGDVYRDVKYALRSLRRTPVFTVIAVAVLAIGIGANATIFSLVSALFLKPLPGADPASLVRIASNQYSTTPHRTYLELRDRNATLEQLAAFNMQSFGMRVGVDVEHVFGTIVSGEYFSTLGIGPSMGRLLEVGDDRPGAPPAVVLSYGLWTRDFAAAQDAVGRTIAINDVTFTVVGVARRGFSGVMAPLAGELWVPLATDALLRPELDQATRLDTSSYQLIGRLKAGVTRERASADLDTIGRQVRTALGVPDRGPAVSVYAARMLHPEIGAPAAAFVALLMSLVGLVLLIVSVNVANLVLARAVGRQGELAIRQSLGANRTRLVTQLLTESLVLSAAGATAGITLAHGLTRLMTAVQLPTPVPVRLDIAVDPRVLVFTTLVAIATALAFGVVPALSVSRIDLVSAIKGVGAAGAPQGRLRAVFLVSQIALSVVLLVVAGLLVRSIRHAQSIDVGFDARNVMTASIDLETRGYAPDRGRELIRTLQDRLAAAPGVESLNLVEIVPLTLSNSTRVLLRDGDVPPAPGQPMPTPFVYVNGVTPGHFATLRIPVVAGRDFTVRDDHTAPRVAVVNETLARQFWPGQQAIGQRLRPLAGDGRDVEPIEIVGIAADSHYVTVGETERPFLYLPLAQEYTPRVTMLVRAPGSAASALTTIRRELRALDPGLPIVGSGSLEAATSISLLPARVAGALVTGLGWLALALAALGIYGVLSFLVRMRMREIGIRVALGATPAAVTVMVVRQALLWTSAGAAVGSAGALLITRFLTTLLYGVSPTDPLTFTAVIAMLGVVAGIAALVPAVGASRIDPLRALRAD
jgi:predicted permease